MIERVDPSIFLHANCSVQMISPRSYREMHLPVEQRMAERIQPFGIHHCGDNMHRIAPVYAELPACFFDIGWGSDIAACRQALPDAFLNLRLNPVRMLQCTPAEITVDTDGCSARPPTPVRWTTSASAASTWTMACPTTTSSLCMKSSSAIVAPALETQSGQCPADDRASNVKRA